MLLISWAFVELTYLPERLFALFHHMGQRSVLAAHDYFSTYYLIIVVFNILRMLTMVVAAALFDRY